MLDKSQQQTLKKLVQDDAWDVLLKAVGDYVDDLRLMKVSGTNAFEELRDLHKRDGRIEGVLEFFDKIEKGTLQ